MDEGVVTLKLSFRSCLHLGSPSLLFRILSVYLFFFPLSGTLCCLFMFSIYFSAPPPYYSLLWLFCPFLFLCMDIVVVYSCFLSSSLLNTLIIPYSVCSVYDFSFVWISLQFILVFFFLLSFSPSSVIFLILSVL